VEAGEPLEPARLVEEARGLLDDLERGDLVPARRAWLAAQTQALLTIAGRLAGERVSYAAEVEGVFGIRPRWYDEAAYERAHALLADALPGTGAVEDRYARWLDRTPNGLVLADGSIVRELRVPRLRALRKHVSYRQPRFTSKRRPSLRFIPPFAPNR